MDWDLGISGDQYGDFYFFVDGLFKMKLTPSAKVDEPGENSSVWYLFPVSPIPPKVLPKQQYLYFSGKAAEELEGRIGSTIRWQLRQTKLDPVRAYLLEIDLLPILKKLIEDLQAADKEERGSIVALFNFKYQRRKLRRKLELAGPTDLVR